MIVTTQSFQKADAVKALSPFLAKFSTLIAWCFSCFDRVLFKGHLPISRVDEFTRFVDSVLKIRRADFLKTTCPMWSQCRRMLAKISKS